MRKLLQWLGWLNTRPSPSHARSAICFEVLNADGMLSLSINRAIADAVADCQQRRHLNDCRIVVMELHLLHDGNEGTCGISVKLHRPIDAQLN